MPNKIRLVFFSFGILEQGGGFETYLVSTASGLAERFDDLEITIVTMSPNVVEKLQYILSFYFLKKQDPKAIYRESRASIEQKLGRAQYKQASSLKELAKILNDSDVIYSKNELLELSVLKRLKRSIRIPIVVGVHTPLYYPNAPSLSAKAHNMVYTSRFYKWLIKDANIIDVNQSEDKRFLEDNLQLHNVSVLHQPIVPTDQRLNRSKKLRVTFVGRFAEPKGVDILVDIIKTLAATSAVENYEFRIAGSGEPRLAGMVADLTRNTKQVTYVGHVSHSELNDLYDWTDVVLVPSRYETLSLVAIETAAAGKVAIASDIPGPREVIENGKTGFLVKLEVAEFVKTLHKLFSVKQNGYGHLAAIGRAAQQKIIDEYDPSTIYGQFYEQISSLKYGLDTFDFEPEKAVQEQA